MATVTPNFNWPVPTSTDLVKDGATAIEALGDSIDASLVDLKGGTTGQVLAKASSADMDFNWVTNADGDITGVTAGTGLTGGGTSGTVSLAFDQANYGGGQFAAGKNKIINGDMSISQRGTTFSNPANAAYTLDRWKVAYDGTGATTTVSQQTFTPGTCPTGYEATSFWRWNVSVTGTGNSYRAFQTDLENVQTFAGQTVTVSFWAKADSARSLSDAYLSQRFGSGGSGQVNTLLTLNSTSLTTSWQRFTATVTLPSISGKTVGASSSLQFTQYLPSGTTMTIDIWGVQLEAGSTATPFQTATGNPASELAACQRYCQSYGESGTVFFGNGYTANTNEAYNLVQIPKMRATPTATFSGTFIILDVASDQDNTTGNSLWDGSSTNIRIRSTSSGAFTGGRFCQILSTTGATFILSAEL